MLLQSRGSWRLLCSVTACLVTLQGQLSAQGFSCDSILVLKISPSMAAFRFHVVSQVQFEDADSSSQAQLGYQSTMITVSRAQDGELVQTIHESSVVSDLADSFDDVFLVEDINFDGFKDLRHLAYAGVTGNRWYTHWIFNKDSAKFLSVQDYTDFCNPHANPRTKEIETFERNGGSIWSKSFYKIRMGQFQLVRTLACEYVEERDGVEYWRYTLEKLVKGRMIFIRSATLSRDEFSKQESSLWR